jgi:hypothetical protein
VDLRTNLRNHDTCADGFDFEAQGLRENLRGHIRLSCLNSPPSAQIGFRHPVIVMLISRGSLLISVR